MTFWLTTDIVAFVTPVCPACIFFCVCKNMSEMTAVRRNEITPLITQIWSVKLFGGEVRFDPNSTLLFSSLTSVTQFLHERKTRRIKSARRLRPCLSDFLSHRAPVAHQETLRWGGGVEREGEMEEARHTWQAQAGCELRVWGNYTNDPSCSLCFSPFDATQRLSFSLWLSHKANIYYFVSSQSLALWLWVLVGCVPIQSASGWHLRANNYRADHHVCVNLFFSAFWGYEAFYVLTSSLRVSESCCFCLRVFFPPVLSWAFTANRTIWNMQQLSIISCRTITTHSRHWTSRHVRSLLARLQPSLSTVCTHTHTQH